MFIPTVLLQICVVLVFTLSWLPLNLLNVLMDLGYDFGLRYFPLARANVFQAKLKCAITSVYAILAIAPFMIQDTSLQYVLAVYHI